MYSIENKASAIIAIQKMLGINETGIYDENTKNTIYRFQEENDLERTGIIDYFTFIKIRDNYIKVMRGKEAESRLAESMFPYKIGDHGQIMHTINSDINIGLKRYTHEDILPRGEYYTSYTASAVKRLREIYMLDGYSSLDEVLYYMIIRDILTSDAE